MEYITTKEASKRWGISTTRITILANEGRIPGAQHLGKSWLIPAGATKPTELKANHSKSVHQEADTFSFPLYHFRPDWSYLKESQLSEQQRMLMQAETAIMECRFADVAPILIPILHAPEDIIIEIGCLGWLGISMVALNNPNDFSKYFLRLQMLLSKDFPHRNDMVVIHDLLNTYMETFADASSNDIFNTDIHEQCIPLTCLLVGYNQMVKEAMYPGVANTPMLELLLRFLQNTGSVVAVEFMHIYLMGIYQLRQNMTMAEKHGRLAIEIAYENKIYFPIITYYRYNTTIWTSILEQYPKEFQNLCKNLSSKYEANFTAFLTALNENSVISKLTDADSPYIYAVLTGLPNTLIAKKFGISQQTVKRRLEKMYEKFGVTNKKELRDYLQHNT